MKIKQIGMSLFLLLLVCSVVAQKGFELNVLPATAKNIQWHVNKKGTDSFETIAGANGQTYLVNDEGMYYATFTDNGCKNASAYFIFIDENKKDKVYKYPLELNSFSGADSYQWYNGSTELSNGKNQKLSVTKDGDYYVQAKKGYCRMTSAHFITRSVMEYVNRPPLAVDDIITVKANESKDVFVLDNDSDPDRDALVSTEIIKQPKHGTIIKNTTGNYTYKPNKNYVGPDTATYKVCDPFGACSEARIIIRVQCLDIIHLDIPQFISPNEDGLNDLWKIATVIKDASCGKDMRIGVKLFNRWGTMVWEASTDNKDSRDFDGKAGKVSLVFDASKNLPPGTYFYVISVEGEEKFRQGYIYIAGDEK